MRFITNFARTGYANSYLLAPENSGPALLIDPGFFDSRLLEQIEGNGLSLEAVLLTHAHSAHTAGLPGILRVYNPVVYAYAARVRGIDCHQLRHGDLVHVGPWGISVVETPGHSPDSVTYALGSWLFTGDTLSAGMLGGVRTPVERDLLVETVRTRLLSRNGEELIFPGHGPPSSVRIERELNPLQPAVNQRRP